MERIQFYPDDALVQKLNADAATHGTSVSTLVTDILRRHYGLIPESELSETQLNQKVFDEVKTYISTIKQDDIFDLLRASSTYASIEMTYAGKPSIIRAKIGKNFAKIIGTGDFTRVIPNTVGGKIVRSENNAATYKLI